MIVVAIRAPRARSCDGELGRASALLATQPLPQRASRHRPRPSIIIGGMLVPGIFHRQPRASGGVAAVYALVIALLVYRELTLERLVDRPARDHARDGDHSSSSSPPHAHSMPGSLVFSARSRRSFGQRRGPQELDPFLLLLLINIFLLIVGLFMETNAAIHDLHADAPCRWPWRPASTRCTSASSWC